ncbi:MAG: stage V sporulation protein SpoVM [Acutalibacteraceae bacterium]
MRRRNRTGCCCAAFGAGMLLSAILPPKLMLILLAAALVMLGCSRAKKMEDMKIVVVKSPKLFGGILRCLFGIKKVSNIDG